MGAILRQWYSRVIFSPLPDPKPGDVMVTWNRHASREAPILAHEAAGGTVLVVENGYFGRNFLGTEWYAMALDQHNGAGRWAAPDADRWRSFGIELQPWRSGEEIVVLASRNMGSRLTREPEGWSERVARDLRGKIDRPVRVRPHPGAQKKDPAPEPDLENAWAAVTWGSSAGLRALVQGVPVFCGFDRWIGAPAARPYGHDIEDRWMGDREPIFHAVASAMWRRDEFERAFRCLLG